MTAIALAPLEVARNRCHQRNEVSRCTPMRSPQPLMAIPAHVFVRMFEPLLPIGLGLAAGAMIWMVLAEFTSLFGGAWLSRRNACHWLSAGRADALISVRKATRGLSLPYGSVRTPQDAG